MDQGLCPHVELWVVSPVEPAPLARQSAVAIDVPDRVHSFQASLALALTREGVRFPISGNENSIFSGST